MAETSEATEAAGNDPANAAEATEAEAPTEAATPTEPAAPADPGKETGKAPAKEESKTLLEEPGEDKPKEAPADFPDDWREKMAASLAGKAEGDAYDKELARLKRFKTPGNVYKSFREIEKKTASGKLKEENPFPADGSDEEKAEWRKAQGLPETPEGYLDNLPDGLVVGDDDKPLVDKFLEQAHAEGGGQEEVNRALSAYYEIKEQQAAEQANADKQAKMQTEDALRQELGNEYRPTMQSIMGMLDGAPEGVKDAIMQGRLADGTPLASHYPTLRWLADIQAELNPAGTVVGAGSGNALQSVQQELTEMEALIADTKSEYHYGPKSAQLKARYRELLDAKQKLESRAA